LKTYAIVEKCRCRRCFA